MLDKLQPMSCEIDDDVTVRRELRVDASAEALWRAITEPGALAGWLADEAELEMAPGGTGRFVDDDGVERLAVVEAIEEGRQLAFRWWPADGGGWTASRVSLTVVADGAGARLLVIEQPAAPAGRIEARALTGRAAGWDARLERLRVAICGPVLAAVV
jgi:uncharacterized protein YndB with AHSA1/START domain